MNSVTLPDDLNLASNKNVIIFDYNSLQEVTKQQIILSQNIFSFLIDGTKEVIFEDSGVSINNSKFLLMKSGHCLMTEKLSTINNYRSILLFFSKEIVLKFIHKHGLNKTEINECKSIYSFNYDAFTQRFVKTLLDIYKLSSTTQNKLLEVKLEEILLYLTEVYGIHFLHSLALKSDDITHNFIQTIESNQLRKLTIKELAFLCNMSISTFKREFEKHFSESPIKWFQNKRLEHAHYLLNQQQKKSSEIYFEIGYENLSSFIKAYKMKYGFTPKKHNEY